MLVISSKEFRDNQASYFDRVDNGEEILVQRGKNRAYKITPVTENDTIIPKDYILAPDEDLARAITAEEFAERVKEHLRELYNGKEK